MKNVKGLIILKRENEYLVELISRNSQERNEAQKLAVTRFAKVFEFLSD